MFSYSNLLGTVSVDKVWRSALVSAKSIGGNKLVLVEDEKKKREINFFKKSLGDKGKVS